MGQNTQTHYKLVLLFIILLISQMTVIAAEDEVVDIKQHIVGATLGIQFHNINNKWFNHKLDGYGSDIFYRRYLYSSSAISWLPIKLYLSGNVGYAQYENEGAKREDISVALGTHFYEFNRSLDFHFGVALGTLHRKEEKTFSEDAINTNHYLIKFFATIMFGFFIPISEFLYLDINLKDIYIYKNLTNHKFNVGLSYSF